MGRLFIECYENEKFTFSCKVCKLHFAHTDKIVIRQIETTYGECIGCVESMNLIPIDNNNFSTYTCHGEFDMFDDNSILESDAKSYFLHCIKCKNFVGWKHSENSAEKHILLKSAIH